MFSFIADNICALHTVTLCCWGCIHQAPCAILRGAVLPEVYAEEVYTTGLWFRAFEGTKHAMLPGPPSRLSAYLPVPSGSAVGETNTCRIGPPASPTVTHRHRPHPSCVGFCLTLPLSLTPAFPPPRARRTHA